MIEEKRQDAISVNSFKSILTSLANEKQFSEMEKYIQEFKLNHGVSESTYKIIIHAYLKSGNITQINNVLKEMKMKNIFFGADIHKLVISELGKSGKLEAMEEYIELNKDQIIFSLHICTAIISTYLKTKTNSKLLYYINYLRTNFDSLDILSYTVIIVGYGKLEMREELKQVINEMKKKQIEPSYLAYLSILQAFSWCGDFESVNKYYQELKAKNIPLNLPTFNIILKACTEKNNQEAFYYFFREMNEQGLVQDTFTYQTIFTFLSNNSLNSPTMMGYLLNLDQKNSVSSEFFEFIFIKFFSQKKYDIILQIFNLMLKFDHLPLTKLISEIILKALLFKKDLSKVQEFVKLINPQFFDTLYFNRVLYFIQKENLFAACGNFILNLMETLSIEIDTFTVNNILAACRTNPSIQIIKRLEKLQAKQLIFDEISYNIMIGCFAKLGKFKDMMQVYESMKKIRILPNIKTFASLFRGLAQVGQVKESLKLLDEMKIYSVKPDRLIMNSILKCYSMARDLKGFSEFFEKQREMKMVGLDTIHILTQGYSLFEHEPGLDRIKALLEEIQIYSLPIEIRNSLLLGYLNIKNWKKAQFLINQVFSNIQVKTARTFIFHFNVQNCTALQTKQILNELKISLNYRDPADLLTKAEKNLLQKLIIEFN